MVQKQKTRGKTGLKYRSSQQVGLGLSVNWMALKSLDRLLIRQSGLRTMLEGDM